MSDSMFATLGAAAQLGRAIEPGDGTPGRSRVALIADSLWTSRFASDPTVIGRTIDLDGRPHVIIGVMPRGFEVFEPGTDVWTPFENSPASREYKATFSQALARLANGASVDGATADLQQTIPGMRKDLAKANDWGRTVRAESLQTSITGDVWHAH